jgi:hypothetical protein
MIMLMAIGPSILNTVLKWTKPIHKSSHANNYNRSAYGDHCLKTCEKAIEANSLIK